MNFLHEGRLLHVPHSNILLRASRFFYLNKKQIQHFFDNKCSIDLSSSVFFGDEKSNFSIKNLAVVFTGAGFEDDDDESIQFAFEHGNRKVLWCIEVNLGELPLAINYTVQETRGFYLYGIGSRVLVPLNFGDTATLLRCYSVASLDTNAEEQTRLRMLSSTAFFPTFSDVEEMGFQECSGCNASQLVNLAALRRHSIGFQKQPLSFASLGFASRKSSQTLLSLPDDLVALVVDQLLVDVSATASLACSCRRFAAAVQDRKCTVLENLKQRVKDTLQREDMGQAILLVDDIEGFGLNALSVLTRCINTRHNKPTHNDFEKLRCQDVKRRVRFPVLLP